MGHRREHSEKGGVRTGSRGGTRRGEPPSRVDQEALGATGGACNVTYVTSHATSIVFETIKGVAGTSS